VGAWGSGPFDNDAAADFLQEAEGSVARAVARTLRAIIRTSRAPDARYIEVDEGGAGWAACELVAIAFGHRPNGDLGSVVLDAAAGLKPKEEHRRLALDALPRIADRATSEIAGLFHEGKAEGAAFDASVAGLKARLEAAAAGPREIARAKKGDAYAIPTAPAATEVFVVQMVGPREAAVFEGILPDDAAALAAVADRPARRVPTNVHQLRDRGRLLGNQPLRKDLRGTKLYAHELGSIHTYAVTRATGARADYVSYEVARAHDILQDHDQKAMLAVACGTRPIAHVRSPEEREAELRARHGKKWASRRKTTTPGPFGDAKQLAERLDWVDGYGVKNWIEVSHRIANNMQGYGRPSEEPERTDYAFAALVAVWRGSLPRTLWPTALKARLPAPPAKALLAKAVRAARVLARNVITPDAELRLIWEGAPDRGAQLRKWVARLNRALA
jgi:hypothetical protein